MPDFRVVQVIDGDTFDVSPEWQWERQQGSRVRPAGYDAPEINAYGGVTAKEKLAKLVLGKTVEIRSAHRIDRGRLVCDVYFGGYGLADYFPEYR
jgi:endonuclease YncB( thermonuclease family)